MGECATCRHWRFEEPDWQFDRLSFGECKRIQQRENILAPARALEDWDARRAEEERLMAQERAIAVDGSGYYAALRTRRDFGCVLHDAGEPTAQPQADREG